MKSMECLALQAAMYLVAEIVQEQFIHDAFDT